MFFPYTLWLQFHSFACNSCNSQDFVWGGFLFLVLPIIIYKLTCAFLRFIKYGIWTITCTWDCICTNSSHLNRLATFTYISPTIHCLNKSHTTSTRWTHTNIRIYHIGKRFIIAAHTELKRIKTDTITVAEDKYSLSRYPVVQRRPDPSPDCACILELAADNKKENKKESLALNLQKSPRILARSTKSNIYIMCHERERIFDFVGVQHETGTVQGYIEKSTFCLCTRKLNIAHM